MKREDIKAVLENESLDLDAKLKAIMDANGNDLNDLKQKNKDLSNKVNEYSNLQAQLDDANKKLETYSTFEEKANKYDEILPKYDEFLNKEKQSKINASAKKAKIKDEFVEFAMSKIGEVEDYDSAFENFAKNNPQFLDTSKIIETNPELKGKEVEIDFSKIF